MRHAKISRLVFVTIKIHTMLKSIIVETIRGKTLPRILMNERIAEFSKTNPLKGEVIDLGSKSATMSYNRFFRKEDGCKITYTDINPESKGVIRLNLEHEFNIKENFYDSAICLNTLEHIYNYKNVIKESYKILKHGGLFIGFTPFLVQYHPDPEDHFRYTMTALNNMFEESGFKKKIMEPIGIGYFSTGLYQVAMAVPKIIRPLIVLLLIFIDKIASVFMTKDANKYALGYFFVFQK